MKTLFLSVALAITGFLFSACSSSPASEKLLLAGSGWNKMVIIDKASKQVQWEYPLEAGWECNSAVWTPDGKILFSYKKGARLMDQDGNILWNFQSGLMERTHCTDRNRIACCKYSGWKSFFFKQFIND